MHILTVGVDFHRTPVAIREKLTFESADLEQALTELRETKSIFEDVIVSTCNRTEIYLVSDQLHTGKYYTKRFFANWFHMDMEALTAILEIKEDQEAVRHLFRVTCGLDSMVLGETQILGQVRSSFLLAQHLGTTGTFFNELFKEAITVAKRAHEQTQINDHPVSVSYAAIELIRSTVGPLEKRSVLMIGAGEMSRLALKYLFGAGVRKLAISNRTMSRAVELAEHYRASALPISQAVRYLNEFDIVIASTSAKHYLLKASALKQEALQHPMVLMDIGVPRNIDPDLALNEQIRLFDIDDLEQIIDSNKEARKEAARQIEKLIAAQEDSFSEWLHTLGVVPVITALRRKALAIQEKTMKSLERKLPELTEQEKKVIGKHAKSMINQMLRDPINKIKELACGDHGRHAVDLFAEVFDLSDQVERTADMSEKQALAKSRADTPDERAGKSNDRTAVQAH
ncbi:MAG: glutamyl-tRNA reductase [Sporolactobacillus sp.]